MKPVCHLQRQNGIVQNKIKKYNAKFIKLNEAMSRMPIA